ncbi:MAG TPA: YbjQ family protein, partial [Ignavibacteria bacterium]|nr:YbjQ family protein [Ignavibacteria bacterium]
MNKIQIITTTSTIEGWQIQKYFGLVTHQVVIGANIFRDVFASFTDIFGGSSKGYQKDLKNMEVIAIKNLKEKASKLGANIIIGLRLDFDEISGGSKSMFMVSASGTAVLGVAQNDKLILKEENNSEITWERLSYEIEKDELEHEINSDDYIIRTKDQIKELTSYNINAIPQVINFMRKISTPLYYNDDEDSEFEPYKNILVDYFGKLPENKLNDFLKSDLFIKLKKFTSRRLLEILNIINWYNYDVLNFLLYNNSSSAHIKALYMLEFSKE